MRLVNGFSFKGITLKRSSSTKNIKSNDAIDVVAEVKGLLPSCKAAYVFWRYAPECLNYEAKDNTFSELKANIANFPQDLTEQQTQQWLLEGNVQAAVRQLLQRKNVQQLLDLHETYVRKAETDHNSLKALLELNKALFAEGMESKLLALLNSIPNVEDGDA